MIDTYLQLGILVITAGGVAYAIHLLWKYAISPTYMFVKALAAFVKAQPVLLEIAEEFKPNKGATLRDQIDAANLRLINIEGQMERLVLYLMPWDGNERRR